MGSLLLGFFCATVSLTILYLFNEMFCLFQNVSRARKLGLPFVVMPMDEMNPFLLGLNPFLRPLLQKLPLSFLGTRSVDSEIPWRGHGVITTKSPFWRWFNFWIQDWAFQTRHLQFETYGDTFLIVKPHSMSLFVANAELATEIYARRLDFPKDTRLYDWVKFYGDNIVTTEGNEWLRHRRVCGPTFSNETVNHVVWDCTIGDAIRMRETWFRNAQDGKCAVGVMKDLKTIPRNAFSMAGFGISLPFEPEEPAELGSVAPLKQYDEHFGLHTVPKGHRMSWGHAFDTLSENVILFILAPKLLTKYGWGIVHEIGVAFDEVGLYLKELLHREKSNPSSSVAGESRYLLGVMALELESKRSDRLTEEEITGNAFIFALAGMETTAGTLQYVLMLLALHPAEQDWLITELTKELEGESNNPAEWDFEKVYPKLVAPMCIIHESLRVFGTHQMFPKCVGHKSQSLNYKGKACHILPGTTVYIAVRGLHDNPAYWGDHTYSFRPRAWDSRRDDSGWYQTDAATGEKKRLNPVGEEAVITKKAPLSMLETPVKGAYCPWSDGVRICLGKKFGLVEMAAVLAVLFADGAKRLEIARLDGETREMAMQRGWHYMRESTQTETVMLRADVKMTWVPRV